MARSADGLSNGSRVADYVSLGVVAKAFPAEKVREVLRETGKESVRERALPAHVVVYYVIALAPSERFADGSYLAKIYPSDKDRRNSTNAVTVRVIEYRLVGVPDAEPIYRLVTTILDPERALASELATFHHERWEAESALDELKTHLRGSKIVLRSKTPDLVRQEFYGLMMAHFAVRGLMHEAAIAADVDPDQLSFVHAVRVIRRKLPLYVAIPPSEKKSLS